MFDLIPPECGMNKPCQQLTGLAKKKIKTIGNK
jgi:hypothetical protein